MMTESNNFELSAMNVAMIEAMDPTELLAFSIEVFTQTNRMTGQIQKTSDEKARLTKNLNMAVTKLKELKKDNTEKDTQLKHLQQEKGQTDGGESQHIQDTIAQLQEENARLVTDKDATNDKMKQITD